jgi:hypothetical protein
VTNQPQGGEIDILEGVNDDTHNAMTLHTGPGCQVGSDTSQFAGEVTTPDCDVKAPNQSKNAGCSIKSPSKASYGEGLNAAGGGVYATQWTDDHISVFFFPRESIPADVLSDSPDPSGWGKPAAKFMGGCDISRMFKQQQIVFNTAFCGDWAGNAWDTNETCKQKAPTCDEYVRDNPEAFAEAHWTINALKVYKDNGQETEDPVPSAALPSSTGIAAPLPVPSSNTSTPSAIYSAAPVPSATATKITSLLSFSSGSYVLPTPNASGIPTSESTSESTPTSQTAAEPIANPTAAPSLAPVQPAPVGSGGMPGFVWPAPSGSIGGSVGSGGSRPGNGTHPKPQPTPSSIPEDGDNDENEATPLPTPEATDAPVPTAVPTDAPAAPVQTIYRTVFVTVPAGPAETGTPSPEGEGEGESARRRRAERYVRARRSRGRRHGGVAV